MAESLLYDIIVSSPLLSLMSTEIWLQSRRDAMMLQLLLSAAWWRAEKLQENNINRVSIKTKTQAAANFTTNKMTCC